MTQKVLLVVLWPAVLAFIVGAFWFQLTGQKPRVVGFTILMVVNVLLLAIVSQGDISRIVGTILVFNAILLVVVNSLYPAGRHASERSGILTLRFNFSIYKGPGVWSKLRNGLLTWYMAYLLSCILSADWRLIEGLVRLRNPGFGTIYFGASAIALILIFITISGGGRKSWLASLKESFKVTSLLLNPR